MKIIEVPVHNEDGSINATFMITPKESQFLLEFALKFLTGIGVHSLMEAGSMETTNTPQKFDA